MNGCQSLTCCMASSAKRGKALRLKSFSPKVKLAVSRPRLMGLYARKAMPSSRQVGTKSLCKHSLLLGKKRREKTTPFEVTLMRSQVLYRAAQDSLLLCDLACYILGSYPNCATVCKFPRQVIEHTACIHMTFGLSKRQHTHVRCSLQR